jgi:hypothetical protein
MGRIAVKPVKVIAHAYLTPCINYPGVFFPYISCRSRYYCISEDAKGDLVVVRAGGVIQWLGVLEEALESSTLKAIRAYFLYCMVDDFRIWLVVHQTPFSILINMPTVLIIIVLAAYTSWRFSTSILTI